MERPRGIVIQPPFPCQHPISSDFTWTVARVKKQTAIDAHPMRDLPTMKNIIDTNRVIAKI
jgi:hypothetical protein